MVYAAESNVVSVGILNVFIFNRVLRVVCNETSLSHCITVSPDNFFGWICKLSFVLTE